MKEQLLHGLIEEFEAIFYQKLGVRADTFRVIVHNLIERKVTRNAINEETSSICILETGTARIFNNWGGDGQSTLLWDWLISKIGGFCYSLDISASAIQTASAQTTHIHYCLGNSIEHLNEKQDIVEKCDLLYLDSFDLDQNNPLPSALHHLMELTAVWAKLPSRCMIVVDDCLNDKIGKHVLVKRFLDELKIAPLMEGYQYIWMKP